MSDNDSDSQPVSGIGSAKADPANTIAPYCHSATTYQEIAATSGCTESSLKYVVAISRQVAAGTCIIQIPATSEPLESPDTKFFQLHAYKYFCCVWALQRLQSSGNRTTSRQGQGASSLPTVLPCRDSATNPHGEDRQQYFVVFNKV